MPNVKYYGKAKQPKAERRLKRELADKQALQNLVAESTATFREIVRTANSSPVPALALGVGLVALGYRIGLFNSLEAGIIYGFTGAQIAGDIAGKLAEALPFSGDTAARNSLQPVAAANTYAEQVAIGKSQKSGYVPE